MNRRRFLAAVGVSSASLSGCLSGEKAADLQVYNESGATQTVSIRATRVSNDKELLNTTITLDDGEMKEYTEVAGEYDCRVNVSTQDGLSNETVWKDSGTDSYMLKVTVNTSSIDFRELAV